MTSSSRAPAGIDRSARSTSFPKRGSWGPSSRGPFSFLRRSGDTNTSLSGELTALVERVARFRGNGAAAIGVGVVG